VRTHAAVDAKLERADTDSSSAAPGSPELRFFLFGHARVEAGGKPYPMATPRKTQQVLAYLLLNRRARIARSHLSYLIWPDETEEGAPSKRRATLFDLARYRSVSWNAAIIAADETDQWPSFPLGVKR
jgi:DNA-binding SARP family transcriptional activator